MSAHSPSTASDQNFKKVQEILFSEEKTRIKALEQQVLELTEKTSRQNFKNHLRQTLTEEPEKIIETIHPQLGKMIRLAVANGIRSLIDRIDDVVSRSLSVEGLRWRIQSLRTGIPLNKIILLNTVIYRVEHIFLTDRKTSQLLKHFSAHDGISMDKGSFSGLVAAITDFAKDVFDIKKKDGYSSFEIEDYKVWICASEDFYLALVVTGLPSLVLKRKLSESISLLQSTFEKSAQLGQSLANKALDKSSLEFTEILKPLLMEKLRYENKPAKKKLFGTLIFTALSLMILWFCWWSVVAFNNYRMEQRQINAYVKETMSFNAVVENLEYKDFQNYNAALARIDGFEIQSRNGPGLSANKVGILIDTIILAYFSPARWAPFVVEIHSSQENYELAKRYEKVLQWKLYSQNVLSYHILRARVDPDLRGTNIIFTKILKED